MRMLHCFLGGVLIAGFVIQMPAQTDPCLDRTIPVNVHTERGEVYGPLTATNFQASIGGKPIRVTSATFDSSPRRIVILIDVSGSMTEGGSLKWGIAFAQELISMKSHGDSLALLTFGSRIEDVVALGQSQDALLAEVEKLKHTDWAHVKGPRRTALRDALANALALIKTPRVGDAILLVSDGGENASQSDWSTVKAHLESSGIRLYAFIPIGSRPRPTEEENGPPELYGLASATGGSILMFGYDSYGTIHGDRKQLLRGAQDFHSEISGFEKLTLELPMPVAKPRHWKLEVVDASGRPNKHLQVIYPERLEPCAPGEVH